MLDLIMRWLSLNGRTRRARVPTVLQMEAVECGAAALAMVLAYFGRFVPLEELRVACGVSRDGSKASNLLKGARSYGLAARGYRREPSALTDLPLPMVIHWNFNHFVVLEGFRGGQVFLNDPAAGPRVVTATEFDEAFTGVALTFEPARDFAPGGVKRRLTAALRSRLAGSYSALAYVVGAGLLLVVPGLVIPTFSRLFVDDVLVTSGLGPGKASVSGHGGGDCRDRLSHLAAAPLPAASGDQVRSGDFQSLPVAHPASADAVLHAAFRGRHRVARRHQRLASPTCCPESSPRRRSACAWRCSMQCSCGSNDRVLSVVAISTAALNVIALKYFSVKRVHLNQQLLHDQGRLLGTAMAGLQSMETLKAMGAEADFFARWSGYQAKAVGTEQRLKVQTEMLAAVPRFLMPVSTALILGLGGLRVMDGAVSMGMLVAFQALMLGFITPVNKMVDLGSTLQEVNGDIARLDDVLSAPRGNTTGEPRRRRRLVRGRSQSWPAIWSCGTSRSATAHSSRP